MGDAAIWRVPILMSRTGYTLPVFAAAAARAALLHLLEKAPCVLVQLDLLGEQAAIPIDQVARLDAKTALGITRSDPGDNLDLTRHTPVWAWVHLEEGTGAVLRLEAGEGLGRTAAGEAAIYRYARQLMEANVAPLVPAGRTATVRFILPEGRALALRTSNAAFGILEGLALLGTSGLSQPLSAADHLESFRAALRERAERERRLVFCIGASGLQAAGRLGLDQGATVQTGNWIGALLVEAGMLGVESVLLLGYQGKLVKLAAGIFNTSSHIADGRLEAIAAGAAAAGADIETVRTVLAAPTADAACALLAAAGWAQRIYTGLAERVSGRSVEYVRKYTERTVAVATVLLDRQGRLIAQDLAAAAWLAGP
nr:cobalt-precorrin-5B (C(1))-methyltransferase CbiD [Gloeobacter morelensis]